MVQLCLKVSTWDSTYRLQSCQWHINQVPLELEQMFEISADTLEHALKLDPHLAEDDTH